MSNTHEDVRVLVVDDEPQILLIMRYALETQGFQVLSAPDGARAWQSFSREKLDLVVLDLMIPVISGVELARRIRTASDVPIIMITALSEESDRIRGLEAGADDYLTKPFSPRELALRAQSLVRRWRGQRSDILMNGDLLIDTGEHRVFLNGHGVDMSDTEVRFLELLAQRSGSEVSYQEFLNQVWKTVDQSGGKDMIKTTAYRVRRALGGDGSEWIQSVRGVGYRMPRRSRGESR